MLWNGQCRGSEAGAACMFVYSEEPSVASGGKEESHGDI